jgi:hypothetical protein
LPINLEFDEYNDFVFFLKTNKGLLLSKTLDGIKESIKKNENVAVIANLLVKNIVFTIRLDREDWISHLDVSIKYFEGIEDYETCAEIKELTKVI